MLRLMLIGILFFPGPNFPEAQATPIHRQVTDAAIAHGVPPALAHAVVRAESNYRCHVRAFDGLSSGIMQVRPATARGVGVHGSMRNCANSLEAGMRYLRQALAKAKGDWCVAASFYNRGTGARPRCTAYGRKVVRLSRYRVMLAGIQG